MNTIRHRLLELLTGNGLFMSEAEAILDEYVASDLGKSMLGRMNDDLECYQPQLFISVWMGVKATAADWMETHWPQHWARPLFDEPKENAP